MRPITLDGLVTVGDWRSWALLSPDGLYRYALGRSWDAELWDGERPILDAFLINPSKADHRVDDPTVRKLIHFGKQEGCGGLLLRNLGAWRATDPRELARVSDPVGPRNLEVLALQPSGLALSLAAWGGFPSVGVRRRLVGSMGAVKVRTTLHVLAFANSGEPRHPLYLPNATRAVRWIVG